MLMWMLSLEFPGTGSRLWNLNTVGHLLGNVITKVGCVMECYTGHTTTVPEPVPKVEVGKMSVTDCIEAQREEKGLRKVIELYTKQRS